MLAHREAKFPVSSASTSEDQVNEAVTDEASA